jgi:plasmid stabilization system protein ParE
VTVEWTRRAREMIGEIHDVIAADAPDTADEFCELLIQATENLPRFPYMGALLIENPAYRQLVMAGYRLVYRIDEHVVYVVTIVSPGMLLEQAGEPVPHAYGKSPLRNKAGLSRKLLDEERSEPQSSRSLES